MGRCARAISKVGDLYLNIPNASLRVCTRYTPGTVGDETYHALRLPTHKDYEFLDGRLNVVEYERELGDEFKILDIATPQEYVDALTVQKDEDGGDNSSRMLLMRITADITGQYQSDGDQSPQTYTWETGCLLYTSPSPRDS